MNRNKFRFQPKLYKSPVIRFLILLLGALAMLLGLIGIFVPLLPTTPFLLLASWCFVRASEKLNRKLLTNRYLGPYITNYQSRHGITLKNKIYSLVFLWLTLISSAVLSPPWWWLWLMLASIGAGVTYHIVSFKTLKE